MSINQQLVLDASGSSDPDSTDNNNDIAFYRWYWDTNFNGEIDSSDIDLAYLIGAVRNDDDSILTIDASIFPVGTQQLILQVGDSQNQLHKVLHSIYIRGNSAQPVININNAKPDQLPQPYLSASFSISALLSTDSDSQPGTNNDIESFKWYIHNKACPSVFPIETYEIDENCDFEVTNELSIGYDRDAIVDMRYFPRLKADYDLEDIALLIVAVDGSDNRSFEYVDFDFISHVITPPALDPSDPILLYLSDYNAQVQESPFEASSIASALITRVQSSCSSELDLARIVACNLIIEQARRVSASNWGFDHPLRIIADNLNGQTSDKVFNLSGEVAGVIDHVIVERTDSQGNIIETIPAMLSDKEFDDRHRYIFEAQVRLDLAGSVTVNRGVYQWLRVVATNASGDRDIAFSDLYYYEPELPSVLINAPLNGSTITDQVIKVSGLALDNDQVKDILITVNTDNIQGEPASVIRFLQPDGSFSANVGLGTIEEVYQYATDPLANHWR